MSLSDIDQEHPGGRSCCAGRCKNTLSSSNPMVWVPLDPSIRRSILTVLRRTDNDILRYIVQRTELAFCRSHLLNPERVDLKVPHYTFSTTDPIFLQTKEQHDVTLDLKRKRKTTADKLERAKSTMIETEVTVQDTQARLKNKTETADHYLKKYDAERHTTQKLKKQVVSLESRVRELSDELDLAKLPSDLITSERMLDKSDQQETADMLVRVSIGVGSQSDLESLFDVCEAYNFEDMYNRGTKPRNMSWKSAILLVLTYYRLYIPMLFLSTFVFPSVGHCSTAYRVVHETALLLSYVLGDFNKKRAVPRHPIFDMPEFNNVSQIIDSLSITIEKIRDSPMQRKSLNNPYYKAEVFKVLVAVDCSLKFSWNGKCFVGSIPDPQLADMSGFWQQVKEGTLILADKGFKCWEQAIQAGARLQVPAFKSNGKLTQQDLERSKHISHLRKEVERMIERARRFLILRNRLRVSMFTSVDIIVSVVFLVSSLFGTSLLLTEDDHDQEYEPSKDGSSDDCSSSSGDSVNSQWSDGEGSADLQQSDGDTGS